MQTTRFVLTLLLASCAATLAFADDTPRPITHEDLWLTPRTGSPVVSPDGRHAVVAVARPAYDPDENESHLWLITTDGSETPRQLTFTKSRESDVAWSPDSRRIAFAAKRDDDDEAQIYLLDVERGGEARRVTSISTGARLPTFSPDGERIAFTSTIHRDSKSDEDSKEISEREEERDYNVRTYDGFPIRNWNKWLDEYQPRLLVQGIDEDEAVDLLAGTDLVAMPGYDGRRTAGGHELDAVWAPDGKSLVFVASHNRDRFAFDYTHNDLWRVSAEGGEPERLTGDGEPEPTDSWSHPQFSPDGEQLYALRIPRTEWVYNAARLAVLDWPAADERAEIGMPDARRVLEYAIAPDSHEVFLLGEDAGLVQLYRSTRDGGEAELAFASDRGVYTNLDVASRADDTVLLANFESADKRAEVIRLLPADGGHEVLTEFTADAVAGLDLEPPEHFWFESDDGARIHNMIVRPAGFDPEQRYPLLVLMHGGPHAMWRDSPILRWNYHLLAGTDYVVLLTNFTGSTGFGEDFARGIQGDPLRGPANEINQAATEAIARFDFIDESRQCAAGASYGGHLANWMQSTTDHYRCLISHAGLVNLETQWGTSDVIYHRETNMGGPPWAIPEVWADQNPIRYAEQWQTPVLVTIGMKDERVPLGNTLEYWSALQRQQIESRLLVYPEQDHWIMRGPESRHFYGEVADWLARWLLEDD
ncbi:MAG: S9 family peptidase [Gammaproteobacteria bacterium]|nr:MAG: S9 family peptidase [Gammaproteobacteria bacterium]